MTINSLGDVSDRLLRLFKLATLSTQALVPGQSGDLGPLLRG